MKAIRWILCIGIVLCAAAPAFAQPNGNTIVFAASSHNIMALALPNAG